MITARDILLGALLPAGVAAFFVLAGALLGPVWRVRRALVPLGIGAAFVAAFAALMQRIPSLPPLDSVDWIFYAAAAVPVMAALDSVFWPEEFSLQLEPMSIRLARWLVRFLIVFEHALLLAWLLTQPLFVFQWTTRTGVYWVVGIALVMSLLWLALDALASRAGGPALAITLATVSALSALTVMLSGSQKLGQLNGMLASALFAAAVLSLFFPRVGIARAIVLVFVFLQTSLIVTASEHVYASLLTRNAIPLLVSAPMAWLGQLVPAGRPRTRAAVRFAAGVAPAAFAAILAAREFAQAATDYLN